MLPGPADFQAVLNQRDHNIVKPDVLALAGLPRGKMVARQEMMEEQVRQEPQGWLRSAGSAGRAEAAWTSRRRKRGGSGTACMMRTKGTGRLAETPRPLIKATARTSHSNYQSWRRQAAPSRHDSPGRAARVLGTEWLRRGGGTHRQ